MTSPRPRVQLARAILDGRFVDACRQLSPQELGTFFNAVVLACQQNRLNIMALPTTWKPCVALAWASALRELPGEYLDQLCLVLCAEYERRIKKDRREYQ